MIQLKDATELWNHDLYNPGKHNYHPLQDATWKKGENVPYIVLAKTLELVRYIYIICEIYYLMKIFARLKKPVLD